MTPGPSHDPRETRQVRLVLFLQVALAIVLATSSLAVVLTGDLGRRFGVATVAVLIAVPLIRLSWLMLRWTLKRDYRFAATAGLLIGIVVIVEVVGSL